MRWRDNEIDSPESETAVEDNTGKIRNLNEGGHWPSDSAANGEVIFPRRDQTELGQPADFRRKRAPFDAEVVRELLAVEGDVKFCRSFLLRH